MEHHYTNLSDYWDYRGGRMVDTAETANLKEKIQKLQSELTNALYALAMKETTADPMFIFKIGDKEFPATKTQIREIKRVTQEIEGDTKSKIPEPPLKKKVEKAYVILTLEYDMGDYMDMMQDCGEIPLDPADWEDGFEDQEIDIDKIKVMAVRVQDSPLK